MDKSTKDIAEPWLWPDHIIYKRESRRLREEHNATVNSHADLLEALEELIIEVDTWEDPEHETPTYQNARAAIAKARGE